MSTSHWDFDLSHSQHQLPRPPPDGVQGAWPLRQMERHARARRAGSRRGRTLDVTIDADSIDTKEDKRDAHLRSADFLEVEKFPTITFKSTQITRSGDDGYRGRGDLTIHGVTKPVTLEVEGGDRVTDPWGGTRTGFSAKTSISRKDFGLTWNMALEAGGFLVGDKLDITLEIEAVKKAATAAA